MLKVGAKNEPKSFLMSHFESLIYKIFFHETIVMKMKYFDNGAVPLRFHSFFQVYNEIGAIFRS